MEALKYKGLESSPRQKVQDFAVKIKTLLELCPQHLPIPC